MSTADIREKRNLVRGAYPYSVTWGKKVDLMTNNQVVAVYFRLKKSNQI